MTVTFSFLVVALVRNLNLDCSPRAVTIEKFRRAILSAEHVALGLPQGDYHCNFLDAEVF